MFTCVRESAGRGRGVRKGCHVTRPRSRLGAVADIGLWKIAAADPERVAVIEPDGGVVSYAELAARADQIGRGLQAPGLRPGDALCGVLPHAAAPTPLFFPALAARPYTVPVPSPLAP